MSHTTYENIECESIPQFWEEYLTSKVAGSETNQKRDLNRRRLGFVDHDRQVWVTVSMPIATTQLRKIPDGVAPELWAHFRDHMCTRAGRDQLFGLDLTSDEETG